MATPAQRTNTWILDEWYDQAVAGTTGGYQGTVQLWIWGANDAGSLGINNTTNYSSPKQLGTDTNWTHTQAITAGYQQDAWVASLKTDGTLWAWGNNQHGQLAQNNTTEYSSPVQVPGTTWGNLQAGGNIAVCVRTDGTLWTWGENEDGALGHNNKTDYSSPKQLPGNTWSLDRTQISASNQYVAMIKTNGTLWSWGMNEYGQLGHNERTQYSSPKQVGTDTTWSKLTQGYWNIHAIKTDGSMWTWGHTHYGTLGDNTNVQKSSPVQIGTATDWAEVNSAYLHTLALKTNGELWMWGNNNQGQNGLNEPDVWRSAPIQVGTDTNWAAVSTGHRGSTARKTDGTLWTWGWNEKGELGHNDVNDRSSPTQVPGTSWGGQPGTANKLNFAFKVL